jgi:hypothetical protein
LPIVDCQLPIGSSKRRRPLQSEIGNGQSAMRLNFWQWLGVALLVLGGVMMLNKYVGHWW